MKNLIVASTDQKFGDFTINHWLKSLKENVNLKNIDIVILDYGMTLEQIEKLKKEKVKIKKCIRGGHVTVMRYRDLKDFLIKSKNKYSQVLMTDGGDLIFQGDISDIFNSNNDKFRVVCETHYIIDFKKVFLKGFFRENDLEKIKSTLNGKKMINAGVIFAPRDKFIKVSNEVFNILIDKYKFGPEQVALNYILYRDNNFELIDEKYNFIPATSEKSFKIKRSIFYFKNNEKITIVHNTGRVKFLRPIKNFGYGKGYNKIKIMFFILRTLGKLRDINVFKH